MRSDYQERRETREANYERLSEKNNKLAGQLCKEAFEILDVFPFGQPILVGHHSEKWHRRQLERADRKMQASSEACKKAKYYANRAVSVAVDPSIFSDNPDAISALKAKLAELEALQEKMKTTNRIVSKKGVSEEEKMQQLLALGFSEEKANALLFPMRPYRRGFESFELTNNNATIKRTKARILSLEREGAQPTTEETIGTIKIRNSLEDNRVQIFFGGKPNEDTRKFLKHHGFKWAPTVGAWQRHRSGYARQLAREAANLESAALAAQAS